MINQSWSSDFNTCLEISVNPFFFNTLVSCLETFKYTVGYIMIRIADLLASYGLWFPPVEFYFIFTQFSHVVESLS